MKRLLGFAVVLFALVGSPINAENGESFSVRRFMLTAGTNDGGPSRVRLRYASSDAQAVAKVFRELGGVESEDLILLLDPDRASFLNGLHDLQSRIVQAEAAHARVELFVYYSGHSDENGLLIGGESVTYSELRDAVGRVPVDVRVIILDSCASGVLTRLKGGKRRAPFLVDASLQMKGHAFLTSSSEDEAAQESDRIGGSFFTNSLVSGLRGAADVTQDKRITLNEAYQFAFYETMANTEGSQSGTQHPAYDIQMAGAGDLVLTDLHGTSAGLILDEGMIGRFRIRDADNCLVVELQKPPGRLIELGLEPGDYRVILERDGEFFGSKLTLIEGGHTRIGFEELSLIATELTTARGALSGQTSGTRVAKPPYTYPKFSFSLWPGMSTNNPNYDYAISTISLNLTIGRTGGVRGFEWGYLANWDKEGVVGLQIAHGINYVEGYVEGLQIAGLLNRIDNNLRYAQVAGGINSVGGNVEGIQICAIGNVVEKNTTGIQLASGANLTFGSMTGIQWSGIGNFAKVNIEGIQLAAGGNITEGHCEGVQASAGFNAARSFRGIQLSILNVAGDANGGQFGLINIAQNVRGVQIGLINIAEDVSGAPIGLLSFVRNGRQNLALWGSDTADLNIGIKLGNRYVYSLIAGGPESLENSDRWFFGVGLGVHIPSGNKFVDVDLSTYGIGENGRNDEDLHQLSKARASLGWQIAPRFALVGGMSLNVFTSNFNDGSGFAKGTWYDDKKDGTWVKVWPGFSLGVQF